MTNEVKNELNQAAKLYKSKKREDAYEIYSKHFNENPEQFTRWDKIRYCWCIYYIHVKDSNDEDELDEYVGMVTDLIEQEDLRKAPVCVYTQCVFKILMFYKNTHDWDSMLYWLGKLNPELLSETQGSSNDRIYPSKKEEFYNFKSKALLECGEFNKCIKVSKKALDTFTDFAMNGDVWHKFRIAKSLRQLDKPQDALTYLEDVLKVQDDWFVLKEFAEDYFMLGDCEKALRYAGEAITTDDYVNIKVNVFYLVFKILKDSDYDLALKHAELFLAIKLQSDAEIPEDIYELEIDEENLDFETLKHEVKNYWIEQEFKY